MVIKYFVEQRMDFISHATGSKINLNIMLTFMKYMCYSSFVCAARIYIIHILYIYILNIPILFKGRNHVQIDTK